MKRKNRTTPTRLFNSRPAQPLPHPKSSNNTTSDKLVVEWMFAPQRGHGQNAKLSHRLSTLSHCPHGPVNCSIQNNKQLRTPTYIFKNLANLKLEKHQRTRLLGKTFFKLSEFSTKSDKRLSTPNFTFL
ncbi:Uncharacterized protein TPS_10025 [Trichinella pseudospiralis]